MGLGGYMSEYNQFFKAFKARLLEELRTQDNAGYIERLVDLNEK